MSRPISGSCIIQDAMQICAWLVFLGLAVAAHTAQSEDGSFTIEKDPLTAELASPYTHRQSSYKINANVALNRSNDSAPFGTGLSNTSRLLHFTEPKNEEDWSINIQKRDPSSSSCSSQSSIQCLDSKDEGPDKPQQDSFWFVLRKAFHF